MDYKLEDLVDISLLQDLQEKLNQVYSFPSAIIDNNGKILTAVAWQDICTKFHRTNPDCEKECIKSDQYIFSHLNEAAPAISYKCPHGLIDNAIPIVIDGNHLGNFFTGQFFLEKPDKDFFIKQAKKYGFNENEYLEAVNKVPIWTKEKLDKYLDFIKGFIEIIAGIGIRNLKEKEINKVIREKEDRNHTILKTALDGFWLLDSNGKLLEVNDTYCRMSGYSEGELLSMNVTDLEAEETAEITKAHIKKVIDLGEDRFHSRHRGKDGKIFNVEISAQYQPDFGGKFVVFIRDITETTKVQREFILAKERAENSEKYLRKIIDNSPLPMVISVENKYIEFVNKKFTELFGYTVKDIPTGEIYYQKAYPDEEYRNNVLKDWRQSIEIAIRNNTNVEPQEYNITTKDGSKRDCEFYMVIIGNKAVIVANDITERKKFETELILAKTKAEESEKRFRSIVENTQAGYFFIDNDGLFQQVNEAWLKLYKYDSYDEVIGKYFTEVQQIDDIENAKKFVNGIRNGNPDYMIGDFSRKCKDGSIGYHSFSARPVINNNLVVGIEGFLIDTTWKKQAEIELIKTKEKIQESEIQFRQLFENMEQGFALHEMIYNENNEPEDYRYVMMNRAFEKLTGLNAAKLTGKTVKEFLPNIEDVWIKNYGKVAQTGIPLQFENYSQDLHKYYDVVAYSPKKDFFAVIFTDITKTKEHQNEIIKAKEKAEESDRLKTAFLHNMSHEIRTPMNAIMGFSELLARNYNNKPKLEYFSNIITQRCSDLMVIIDDILDIAKIESGQLTLNIEQCNLNSLFEELSLFFIEQQKKLGKQHIDFNFRKKCDSSKLIIATDEIKLKQILINLIGNAFKFTDKGKIEVGCKLDDANNIIFFVSDTGVGIPSEKQEMIFDRFTQIEAAPNRIYGGTGLGLSIVKGLANLLGGKIWLKSEPGTGTTFYFSIPYIYVGSEVLEHPDIQEEKTELKLLNKAILIVEDDEFNASYITEVLAETGANITCVQLGRDAVHVAITKEIDLVLMDIRLPDISGYEAVRQIKKEKPNIKIIAQTAYAASQEWNKAIEAGCVDYISKPINSKNLLSIVKKHLSA